MGQNSRSWIRAIGRHDSLIRRAVAATGAFTKVFALLAVMIGLCMIPAGVLVIFFDIDPLTAYLATSPGGVDSIVIIASGCPVDMPFIIGAQMFRLLTVLSLGPTITRYIAQKFSLTTTQR